MTNTLFPKGLSLVLVMMGVLVFGLFQVGLAQEKPPIILEPLPFATNALEPVISEKTFSFHHGKHHATYVETANTLLKGTPFAGKPIEEIVLATAGNADQKPLFNAIAQCWNHSFFWKCLKPQGGGKPDGKLAKLIDESFGSFEKFKEEFISAGKSLFGSGWVWLVRDGEKLKIVKGSNAETPLSSGQKPLFVIDVWEHAYYLDYQNRRADYLKAILENLVNWDFVTSNL